MQRFTGRAGGATSLAQRTLELGEGGPDLIEQSPPERRELNTPAGPLEQGAPDAALKLPHSLADPGRRHAQPLRGPAEVQLLGDCHEGFELTDLQARTPLRSEPPCYQVDDSILQASEETGPTGLSVPCRGRTHVVTVAALRVGVWKPVRIRHGRATVSMPL
jgi:hypothetical protein